MDLIDKLKSLIEEIENYKSCCQKKCEDEEDECAIIEELEENYNSFFFWALGTTKDVFNKQKAILAWNKRHPTLPLPRVLKAKVTLNPELATVCFFMDAYPLYLETLA